MAGLEGEPTVLGADGCRGNGWVALEVSAAGLRWHHVVGVRALLGLAAERGAAALAMDVPIGLRDGVRECDRLARARLPGAASSVFAAPSRAVLACQTYAQARTLQPSLSAQAFGLVPRIRDVDEALPLEHDAWVVECHPEVTFRAMTARARWHRKKSATGALQRLRTLETVFGPLPEDVPGAAGLDDALDAAACAWTAQRWASGEAEVLGGETDACGKPMRIVV